LQLTQSAALSYATPNGKARVEAALNLVGRFASSNIHLWGPGGTIKRYAGPAEIIEDFFVARLRFYELRKEALQKRLVAAVKELGNKHRFAGMVADGTLVLFRKSRAEVEAALVGLRFDPHAERGGFQYLLGTAIVDFTADRVAELKSRLDARSAELARLQQMTPRQLWKEDLVHLRAGLVQR
jgi:DNA topoisomerase-2